MRPHVPRPLAAALALGLILALSAAPRAGWATNGMFLTSYGAEASGRGGADLAISDRSLGLNFNPAGIAQLQGQHLSANLSLLAPKLEFENGLNRRTDAESRYFPLPALAYVRAGKDTRWSWGVGLLAQGGMGASFHDLNTPFGIRDETRSEVRFATLTPTLAYSITDDLAIGAALHLGYADASFRFFPGTSFFNRQAPENSFFGVKMAPAGGAQTSARLGLWWRPAPKVSFGAIYQTRTKSDFSGGDLTVNFTDHPQLGRKVHYKADLDGFTFAAQAGVGVAVRPNDSWVVALDVKRYFWDSAIDTITVTGRDPDTPGAPPVVTLPFVFDWKDQWVTALGADFRVNPQLTLRAGYNYGENPVPGVTLTPLFPATVEQHLSLGAGWLSGNRLYDFAIERAFNRSQTNNNPDPRVNPFGPGARVEHSQWTVSLGVSWVFDRAGREP